VKPAGSDVVNFNSIDFSHDDIGNVVDAFYTQVATDTLLKVPFATVHDWPDHIGRMTHFWWVRLGGRPYLPCRYNPVAKHFAAGFNAEFLGRWLELFKSTLRTKLTAPQIQIWSLLVDNMGQSLHYRNEMLKQEGRSV